MEGIEEGKERSEIERKEEKRERIGERKEIIETEKKLKGERNRKREGRKEEGKERIERERKEKRKVKI